WSLGIESWACRCLLAVVILESLIDLSIEGNILWRFNQEAQSSNVSLLILENKRRLPVYLVIFGLAHLWQLVLTIIAVRTRNTIQAIAVTMFNFAFLGYAVIEIFELRQILGDDLNHSSLLTVPLNVLTAVVIAVVAVGCCLLVGLSIKLRKEFGWERYRFLGADLQIRKLYARFQVFECICYFSAFFCAGFGIQFIWLVLQPTDAEYIVTWIMFPLSIMFLVVGRFAAKYENKYAMAAFMFGIILGLAYFIYKLIRVWQQTNIYSNVTRSLTLFDILSLLSLLLCMAFGITVWKNFGKGLKQASK
ncbi:hypothetical protein TREMEDRAFT_16349, partial [Tremella mesenterica DSM 1558]|uniref:uncharacterized protein n=1 Tax=Tremella mesenterica (strain ATCC 24925 / CBS 8224 / DSM 1558 / NBRC 9311 / NRRL Y-6157 / RJB 2259-6 / UBC 559-6) TaxID=578456 RepID=UPI0003F492F7